MNALYAGYEEGSYLRGEHRCRAMLDRGVMIEEPDMFVRYTIESPDYQRLDGIVGLLDLDRATVFEHEGVMASSVAARSADIERAGAFLEPVVVAMDGDPCQGWTPHTPPMRAVTYGDETHTLFPLEPGHRHGIDPETSFVVIDGHHRIAAARQHAALNGIGASILAMVVDVSSPGLRVVPQHRVLGGAGVDPDRLGDALSTAPYRRGAPVAPGAVAIVGDGVSFVVANSDQSHDARGHVSSVTLEDHLLGPLDVWVEGFATREQDAYRELAVGATAVAIMGDLAMDDVVATARSGIVLPEKTTCFSPKVAVGLVGVTA